MPLLALRDVKVAFKLVPLKPDRRTPPVGDSAPSPRASPARLAVDGLPNRGIALPRMTFDRRWSSRSVSCRTREVICCMSRIMVAVSVRGSPPGARPGKDPPAAEPEREATRDRLGEARAGEDGDDGSPYECRWAVRVERPRGARKGV